MRSHYWTCSKFADWLRGTPKPGAATGEGWDEWTEKAMAAHPFRYWLADDALHFCERVFYYPTDKLYDLKYYINNRFITRTHSLTAHPRDIKPGDWCDVGNRFLPCLFNELVDFIEVEQAWHHIAWNEEERKKFKTPFWAFGWMRVRTWRSPEAGLAHLDWEMSLNNNDWLEPTHKDYNKPTDQAVKAKELRALYDWWTVTRPARPDPYEASGWSAICEARRIKAEASGKKYRWLGSDDKTPAEKKETAKSLKILHKLEEAYEKEDEDMMIRLIKVRRGLWT